MEKKTIRNKLYKLYESAGIDEINGDGKMRATFEFDKLVDFISQELSKAREKGIKTGMRGLIDILCEKGCGSVFAVIEESDVSKKIKELSKLKDNKQYGEED